MADERPDTPNEKKEESPQRSNEQRPPGGRPRRRRRRYQRPPDSQGQETSPQQQKGLPPRVSGETQRGEQIRLSSHDRQKYQLDLSVVIPLYNEEESLHELYTQLSETLSRSNSRYELLFVDDGSTDDSFRNLRDLKRRDQRIKIIRLRRNYGKSAALSAGFEHARGAIVITMDADLQDDPSEIPALVQKVQGGYDLISGWKKVRYDPLSKTIPSRFFNFVTSRLTGIKLHDFNCGLKAYRNEVVKSVRVYGELHRYVPVLAKWEGFIIGEMVVKHRARKYGKTKFGVGRFWKGFLDLLTVLFTTRYFGRPLHLFGFWGLVALLAGVGIDAWLAGEWFMGETALGNRPLFLGGILLIIVGIQMISIGLLGEMITKARHSDEGYQIRDHLK